MRLSFMLSGLIAAIYCASCTATADFDQNKISMVHSLDARLGDDAGGRRFLREHQEKESDTEERILDKVTAKLLAKSIINNPEKSISIYNKWEKKYTLSELTSLLRSKKGKYNQVLNGYAIHLDHAA
ncbi:hypothetical protein P3T76_013665 [Phytophthora citrophthora]|uniref:RxLR effector protein n=1 Tax=Phytophthora citrophthora TaxID=4793 RepID=A0AAD9G2J1_9STRA|nr:hypothetical protein P3T76_013665 [Phytophthora citrophthora]